MLRIQMQPRIMIHNHVRQLNTDSEYKDTMTTHEIKHCIITARNVFVCEEVLDLNTTVVILL